MKKKSKTSGSFGSIASGLRLPERIESEGLLVGWSLEQFHKKRPIGFNFGDLPGKASEGFVDPVLLEGEGHLITVAPTGAGKGVGCIVPALLRYPGPVIVIDPKGENAAITARRRKELGQDVIVLDPMRTTKLGNAQMNPLDLIDPESAEAIDDVNTLIDQLLAPMLTGDRDRFWTGRARQILAGAIIHVLCDRPERDRTLSTVREVINLAASNPSDFLMRLQGSRHPEARMTAAAFDIGAPETIGGYLAFAQEAVDFIRGPLVAEATSRSSFDIADVTRGRPMSIFIIVPPHMLHSLGRLLRLWVGALMIAIMRRRAKPSRSTLFILDEAAQLGQFNELRQAVTLLRGYGLQTWSFWQDGSQLRQLYPNDWQTMVNNSKVVQLFGANTMLAATEMSNMVGYFDGHSVLDLKPDEMLLQIAGDEAVIAKLPSYLRDPPFKGLYDTNPFYDQTAEPFAPRRTPFLEYVRPRPRPQAQSPLTGERADPVKSPGEIAKEIIEWHRRAGSETSA